LREKWHLVIVILSSKDGKIQWTTLLHGISDQVPLSHAGTSSYDQTMVRAVRLQESLASGFRSTTIQAGWGGRYGTSVTDPLTFPFPLFPWIWRPPPPAASMTSRDINQKLTAKEGKNNTE